MPDDCRRLKHRTAARRPSAAELNWARAREFAWPRVSRMPNHRLGGCQSSLALNNQMSDVYEVQLTHPVFVGDAMWAESIR